MHAPIEEGTGYTKNGINEGLECVFDQFFKYRIKILLGGFKVKVGREDIFKPTNRN